MAELTVHHRRLLDNMATLMDDGNYSDFVISCQGRHFNVHKAIMCSASPILAAAFNMNMAESQTGVFEHTEYDADTVERMISYVYKTEYDLPQDVQVLVSAPASADADEDNSTVSIPGPNAQLIAHTRMYAIGSYYQLPTLGLIALQNFASCTKARFETTGFIHVLREVDTHIRKDDRDFRDAVRTLALDNLIPLTQDNSFMIDLAEVGDVQEFAAEMLRQVVQDRTREREDCAEQERRHMDQIASLDARCTII